jgi:hypothetical protein
VLEVLMLAQEKHVDEVVWHVGSNAGRVPFSQHIDGKTEESRKVLLSYLSDSRIPQDC